MKIIKSIAHKLIPAALLAVTGFSVTWATEPQDIIDYYAQHIKSLIIKEKDLSADKKTKIAGNVLAYKNCDEQTIVLKSGNYFAGDIMSTFEVNDDVIVIPLANVVAIIGANQQIFDKYKLATNGLSVNGEDDIVFTPSENEIKNYIDLATEGTNEAWQKQFIDHQCDRLTTTITSLDDAKKAVLKNYEKNIQNLDQLRHTEFQIHALLNAFFNPKSDEHKNLLQLLLPKNITLDKSLDEENSVYSLFEACNSCKLVPWLTMNNGVNKNFFKFKVLDAQVLKYGKAVLDNFHSQTVAENLQNAITVLVKDSNGKVLKEKTTTIDLYNCNFNANSITSYMIACKNCLKDNCRYHSNSFFIQWRKSMPQNLNTNLYQQHYKIEINNDISPLLQDIKTFISSKKRGK